MPDANITQSSVTQHEAALTITESQISDLTHTTDTNLSEEQVEDFVGGMLGGTETLIAVTYQDGTNDIDFVVDNDLSNYSNATSAFITAGDLDGDGIYDGSGTVPTTTVVTLTDNINFGSELFIDGTGVHIGSGTTAGATLDIEDVGTQDLFKAANRFRITDSGIVDWGASAGSYGFLSWDTGKALIGARSGIDLVFSNDAGYAMRLLSNGDLLVDNLNTSDFLYSEVDTIKGGSWSGVNLSEFNDDIGVGFTPTDIDTDYGVETVSSAWTFSSNLTLSANLLVDDIDEYTSTAGITFNDHIVIAGTEDIVVGADGVAFFATAGGAWAPVGMQGVNLGDFDSEPTYGAIALGTYNFAVEDDAGADLIYAANNGTQVKLGTLAFDTNETMGAGLDDFVLTYDNGTGLISLEASAGGSDGDGLYDGSGTAPTTTVVSITDNLEFGTDLLYLDESASEVGIDIAAPVSKVHINHGGDAFGYLRMTTTATGATSTDGAYFGMSQAGVAYLGTRETQNLQLDAGGTSWVYLTPAGNFGIGKAVPVYKAHIGDSDASANGVILMVENESATTGDAIIGFEVNTANNNWRIGIDNSDADAFKIAYGTTLDGNDLVIEADGDVRIDNGHLAIEEPSSSGTHLSLFNSFTGSTVGSDGLEFSSGNGTFNIFNNESGAINIGTSGSTDIQINTDGSVGFGDYGAGNNTGVEKYNVGVDSNGDLIETPKVFGGAPTEQSTSTFDWDGFAMHTIIMDMTSFTSGTFVLQNPVAGGYYGIQFINVTGTDEITWPSTVQDHDGTNWGTGADVTTEQLVVFFYDGTNYNAVRPE